MRAALGVRFDGRALPDLQHLSRLRPDEHGASAQAGPAGARWRSRRDVGGGTNYSMLATLGEAYKVQMLTGYKPAGARARSSGDARQCRALESRQRDRQPSRSANGPISWCSIPSATPVLASRQELSQSLEDMLFALVILGDDRDRRDLCRRPLRPPLRAEKKLHERPYPRDLKGYGRAIPDPRWPGGAHVAVQFVLNYEEGGENNILHGDAASEAFLSEIVGAQPWPGQRHWNMESIYEYGARAGFWRLWRLFTGRKVPLTIYGVATALMRSPEQVAAMKEADWEIASHGLKWIEHKDMPEDDERQRSARGHPHPHGGHRRAAARLVHRPLLDEHHAAGDGGGRVPLLFRRLLRRPALLARAAARRPASDHPLHARLPTTCASPRRRASIPAISSSAI